MPTSLLDLRSTLPELEGMDDRTAVSYLHESYYPDMPIEKVAAGVGYKIPPPPVAPAGFMRTAADMAIKGAQGVVDVGQSVVGLGSLATGGLVGKGMRAIGYDPETTNQILGTGLSDQQRESEAEVQKATGFVDSLIAMARNPRAVAGSIVESIPGVFSLGGVQAAAAKAIALKAAAPLGGLVTEAGAAAAKAAVENAAGRLMTVGAAAEGAQSAGQIADQAQAAGRDYSQYALPSIASGLTTGAINRAAGGLMGSAETKLFTGAGGVTGNLPMRIGKSLFSEGVLEEMPQSATEQVFTNIAMGKPWDEGVAAAAAGGLVTGGLMGAGMGALQGKNGHGHSGAAVLPTGLETIAQEHARADAAFQSIGTATNVDAAVDAFNASHIPLVIPDSPEQVATARLGAQLERSRGNASSDPALEAELSAPIEGLHVPAAAPATGPLSPEDALAAAPATALAAGAAGAVASTTPGNVHSAIGAMTPEEAQAQRERDRPAAPTGQPQAGDLMRGDEMPYRNMSNAMARQASEGGESTHDIVRVAEGLVVRPKPAEAAAVMPPAAPAGPVDAPSAVTAESIAAVTQPVTMAEATAMVAGKTEKPGGVDPVRMLGAGAGNGREYRFGDVPLSMFIPNQEGERYDGTVDASRARDYAERGPGAPPIIAIQGRDGALRVNDGGHRITAARMRGDATIPTIVAVWQISTATPQQTGAPVEVQGSESVAPAPVTSVPDAPVQPGNVATPDAAARWNGASELERNKMLTASGWLGGASQQKLVSLPWEQIKPSQQARLSGAATNAPLDGTLKERADALKAKIKGPAVVPTATQVVTPEGGKGPAPKQTFAEMVQAAKDSVPGYLGRNTDGEVVYQDARGVRSILRDGVRSTESVQMRPTRDSGMQIAVEHKGQYLTANEAKQATAPSTEEAKATDGKAVEAKIAPPPPAVRPDTLIELRKRASVLESLRKCLG